MAKFVAEKFVIYHSSSITFQNYHEYLYCRSNWKRRKKNLRGFRTENFAFENLFLVASAKALVKKLVLKIKII